MSFSQEINNFINLQFLLTKSTEIIRNFFLTKWKDFYGKDWVDGEKANEDYFKNGHGKMAYSKMYSDQKQRVIPGDISTWDLTLFYHIFTNTNLIDKTILKPIEEIKDIRNLIAHSANMSLNNEDYEKSQKQIAKSLISLGYDEQEFEKVRLKLNQNETILENERAKELREKANELFKNNKFVESIEFYSKAIQIETLSNNQKATLYSNRSLAYLKLFEKHKRSDRDYLFKALVDAEQANNLNPRWVKTYVRLAQVYSELNENEKSIEYYTKALVLDPANEEIKNSLAHCKHLNFEQNRLSHLDKSYQPKTIEDNHEEHYEKMKNRLGGIEKKEFSKQIEFVKKMINENDPNIKDVWLGHEYRDGSAKCEQNYELAAKYYSKAGQNGNAEGLYNLALLTKKGLGVKQDFKMATNLLKQAASQPAFKKIGNLEFPNVGVAESEHLLGILYQQGIYVSKNMKLAIDYYQSAVDHGCSKSANNLGILYLTGDGVKTNLDRAENLFLFCHKKGCNDSVSSLVDVYLAKLDPEQALLWHQRDLKVNPLYAMNRNDFIMKQINDLKKEIGKLNKEESQNFMEIKKKMENFKIQTICSPNSETKINKYDPEVLYEHAQKGSVIATKMYNAQVCFFEGLIEFLDSKNSDNLNMTSILDKMSKAYQIESLVCLVPSDIYDELLDKLEKIISKNLNNDLDFNARICYMFMKMSDYKQNIEFITETIKKYPNCDLMYQLRGSMYCFLDDFKNGIKDFDHVILNDKNNFETVYLRAAAFKNMENFSKAIKDYENFINNSPIENRKIPEAYYSCGLCKIFSISKKSSSKSELTTKIAQEYYEKGEKCEKLQLPCFLPYESRSKLFLEKLIDLKFFNNEKVNETNNNVVKNEYNIEAINRHRKFVFQMQSVVKNESDFIMNTLKPPKVQMMTHSLVGLKEIKLKQIDFTKDEVLKGYILTVRIFDVPIFGFTSVHFLVDDDTFSVETLSVYNLGKNYAKIGHDFKIGTWVSIIDPYIRQAADGFPLIRVDDPKSIIFTGKYSDKMCRYCGKENSKFHCAKCSKAFYCSKECQVNDWKIFNHKLVCF